MALVALLILQILGADGLLQAPQKVSQSLKYDGDIGEPLYLTPYIESGKIELARKQARVSLPGLPDIESYAGFFTVDKAYKSNHFVWYFPFIGDMAKTALTTNVWLQGGPGVSSLYGLFEEIGPIQVVDGSFQKRQHHWTEFANLIFIDNPVGAGFSFTGDSQGYCTNQTQIGEQLYATLHQVYQMFPELLNTSLVISGEAYGGKYAPALAYTIHKNNPSAKARGKLTLPLAGLSIGNGWSDPINQIQHPDLLYQIGLISLPQRDEAKKIAATTLECIKRESWHEAYMAWSDLVEYLLYSMEGVFYYDYAILDSPLPGDSILDCNYCDFINTEQARKAIHVGNLTFDNFNHEARRHLENDIMQSVAPWISELLESYSIIFYTGQQDIVTPCSSTPNFIRHLNWSDSETYNKAGRIKLLMESNAGKMVQAAYLKIAGKLWELMLRGAGHMAPKDRPMWCQIIMLIWINNYINNSTLANGGYFEIEEEDIDFNEIDNSYQ